MNVFKLVDAIGMNGLSQVLLSINARDCRFNLHPLWFGSHS